MSALAASMPGFETTPKPRLADVGQASKTVQLQWIRAHRDAVAPVSRQPVSHRLAELAATWREERGFSSSLTDMVLSPSYQKVIALGRPVVPYLLVELAVRPDHWFWALSTITGVNPVSEQAAGNLQAMTQAWLRWGDKEGQLD
jgi:hypothetical protein